MATWWKRNEAKSVDGPSLESELRLCIASLEAEVMRLRQRQEPRLESEERFRSLFEQNLDSVFTLDSQGRVTSANPAAVEKSGYSLEELRGKSILQLVAPESLPAALASFNRALLGESCDLDAVILTKDGARIDVFITGGPIMSGGAAVGIFGIAKDVTERNQFQRQLQQLNVDLEKRVQERTKQIEEMIVERDRLERELLDITNRERQHIGQELYNSVSQHLTAILLLCKVLEEKAASTKGITKTEIAELTALASLALEQARGLAHGLCPVETNGLVPALEELAADTQRLHHVSCTLHAKGDVEPRDSIAALQLYRIANEAITNALRHGHARHLNVSLVRQNGTIQLTVRDDGQGFDPRAAGSKAGRGLAIMRHRAEIIRACFDIRRRENETGTIVTCAVPVNEVGLQPA